MKKGSAIVGSVLVILVFLLIWQRHQLLIWAIATDQSPALLAKSSEGPEVVWFDDYFTTEKISENTYAIGEPRYHQQNFSYLIIGEKRALLFDAGPGLFDIRSVAESLTDLPITFMPSHFHFDHVGNNVTFSHVAVVDLPYLRERARNNQLTLTPQEHLGSIEGFERPTFLVDEWVTPGDSLDLGGRQLQVVYTPGHTEDSISLVEEATGMLFSGDFIYPGPLFAFLSNSSLSSYLSATHRVLDLIREEVHVFGAHRSAPPGAPVLGHKDLQDLQSTLEKIRSGELSGEGLYPVSYKVNNKIELLTEPGFLQDW